MKVHQLSGRAYVKAAGIGVATAVVLSAIMLTALKAGVSPMPQPVALAFAETLFGTKLPLPLGLLFHVAWVMLWSVAYVVFFWERLTFARAAGLSAFLWVFALVVFFPFIGWGFLGLAVSPKLIIGALVSHMLFALVLWTLVHWVFGTYHEQGGRRYSGA